MFVFSDRRTQRRLEWLAPIHFTNSIFSFCVFARYVTLDARRESPGTLPAAAVHGRFWASAAARTNKRIQCPISFKQNANVRS